jgi:hypothetical protein
MRAEQFEIVQSKSFRVARARGSGNFVRGLAVERMRPVITVIVLPLAQLFVEQASVVGDAISANSW